MRRFRMFRSWTRHTGKWHLYRGHKPNRELALVEILTKCGRVIAASRLRDIGGEITIESRRSAPKNSCQSCLRIARMT